ncbi:DUF5060 domain-containing protein [Hyunsoonleella ulvae]|uniref:DUF5060 domain-containing protein n=1 Tax=Hyunsoonleella ulvae TaxID=2799948 RepID=UPI001939C39B|nr:DUF5060 domain-containing protein [Hyunsoonleella ulvae]
MKRFFTLHTNCLLIFLLIVNWGVLMAQDSAVTLEGNLKKWHKLTLSFEGETLGEHDEDNPFLNYRLNVIFKNNGRMFTVPGFFAADGNAAETSATSGNIWKVRFVPDAVGEWEYEVFFRQGKNIAISDNIYEGNPIGFNGVKGTFTVSDTPEESSVFRRKGRLLYDGTSYPKHAGTNDVFLKGGAGSPENFLAYYEFDQTQPSHKYTTHTKDWKTGNPTWKKGKGKSIIGALNYLASKGMNSVYFLTMNVQGDGDDVWPWTNKHERYRFDCSKLDQWEIVFDHMDNLGMVLHIITQETENELLLDIGELKTQRKLYYRELIARFSHHLGVIWNLGEENGWQSWSPKAQSDTDRKAMARYLKTNDPYKNLVVIHTHAAEHAQDHILNPLLGYPYIDGVSMQIKKPEDVHYTTKKWIETSKNFNKPWIAFLDEIGPAHTGAKPDADDVNHDDMRTNVLWGNLMAGGAGVEWYFGYKFSDNDLKCEDWRSRDKLWEQTKHALDFFKMYLPYRDMMVVDDLTQSNTDFVLAKKGEVYAIYQPKAEELQLDLTKDFGKFSVRWYNPRVGGGLRKGKIRSVKGGALVTVGLPPSIEGDWVALIKKVSNEITKTKIVEQPLVLNALTDFQIVEDKVTYYKDKKNNALAIKASKEDQRQGFASAKIVFTGSTGMYNIILDAMAEQDGESSYAVMLNNIKVKTIQNPQVSESFKKVQLNLGVLYLSKGDTLTISSNANSNGKLPEKEGTAWSRGRWNSISLSQNKILNHQDLQNADALEETNGSIEIEAEDFHLNTNNHSPRKWYVRHEEMHAPFLNIDNHTAEASGKAYIEALPDTRITHKEELIRGENFYPIPGTGGIVGYKVNIKTPGRYYVWVKAFSSGSEDNGVHVGLDGHWPESGQRIQLCKDKHTWAWSSAQRVPNNHCGLPNTIYLDVKEAGDHVIMFSMREDGFELDKFILTKDVQFKPL